MKTNLNQFNPAVGKRTLLFLGGGVWMGVGVMLLTYACHWLSAADGVSPWPFIAAGVLLAMGIHHFGFLRIVNRNLGRILPSDGKKCLFSFMPWRSYLIVAVMIGMGRFLRHSSIPKSYLSILYIGIGLALILSSIRYFRVMLQA